MEREEQSRAERRDAEIRVKHVAPIHPLTAARVRMGIVAIRAESLSMPERRSNRQVAKGKEKGLQFHLCLS